MDFTTLLVALSFISLEVSLNIIVKKGLFGVRKQKSESLPHTPDCEIPTFLLHFPYSGRDTRVTQ